jgi:hypothetical protein
MSETEQTPEEHKGYAVYRDGKKIDNGLNCLLEGLAPGLFALSQYHGGGEYVAVESESVREAPRSLEDTEPEKRTLRLAVEWLEEGVE